MNLQPFFDRLIERTILPLIPKRVTPNQVTAARFAMTPIVLYFILVGEYGWGLLAFLFVALTDSVDGALARTRNQITQWGTMYDPLADKLLIMSMVFGVVVRELDVVLGITIVVIETTILGLGWYAYSNGHPITANRWGKLKMSLEVIGVSILLLGLTFDVSQTVPVSKVTFILAAIFALVSLVTYSL